MLWPGKPGTVRPGGRHLIFSPFSTRIVSADSAPSATDTIPPRRRECGALDPGATDTPGGEFDRKASPGACLIQGDLTWRPTERT